MPLVEKELSYFKRVQGESDRYWNRFDHIPDMKYRCVLEIGCGHGALCIDAAQRGAEYVVGIHLEEKRIEFARENLQRHYPELVDRIEFLCIDVMGYSPSPAFDYVISKDTFEHIIGLEMVLQAIAQRLKPGGRLHTGFGPLYHAPYGDHCRLDMQQYGPWGHLLLNEARLIRRLNRRRNRDVSSIADLGLNQLTIADYRNLFQLSGLNIVEFKTNIVGRHSLKRKVFGQIMSCLSYSPFLSTYMTSNIYAVLEKPTDA